MQVYVGQNTMNKVDGLTEKEIPHNNLYLTVNPWSCGISRKLKHSPFKPRSRLNGSLQCQNSKSEMKNFRHKI